MGNQIVAYPCNGILLNYINEGTTDTYSNMAIFQKLPEQKKPNTGVPLILFNLYEILEKAKLFSVTKKWIVCCLGLGPGAGWGEGLTIKVHEGILRGNVGYIHCQNLNCILQMY